MKRYLISTVVVLAILVTAWAAFGQQEDRRGRRPTEGREGREGFGASSPEERARMRERWQNMSEEERQKFREQMRQRFAGRSRMNREEQLKALKAIEEQVAKLKAGIQAGDSEDRRSFRDLSEEERTKLRERFTKARQDRQKALQAIIAQVARLQGQRQPAEGEELLVINTGELKPIHELAVKEKAKETAQRLERLISRGQRGFRGRPPAGPRTGTTTPRTTERSGRTRRSGREQRER